MMLKVAMKKTRMRKKKTNSTDLVKEYNLVSPDLDAFQAFMAS